MFTEGDRDPMIRRKPGQRAGLTEDDADRAFSMYEGGMGLRPIGRVMGVSAFAVRNLLKRFNKPIRIVARARLLTESEKALAVSRYIAGESSVIIAADLHCDYGCVLRAVRAAGHAVRPLSQAVRQLALNEGAFDEWSREALYWAGVLTADGCIRDDGAIILSLNEKDAGMIYAFRSFLESGHAVSHRPSRPQSYGKGNTRMVRFSVS